MNILRSRSSAGHRPAAGLSWTTAVTLPQLGELTARWLTGELPDTPTFYGPPDVETVDLVELLAAVNRAGLVTDFSQPGHPLTGDGYQQRAAVAGFCDPDICARLADAFAATDLVLLHEHDDSGIRLPVTLAGGVACTWVGGAEPLDIWAAGVGKSALRALADSWFVSIVDPVWGRNDQLWRALAGALGLDVTG